MAGSEYNGKEEIVAWVKVHNIKNILDVGPGQGTYARLFKENEVILDKIDGVEVWEPYLERFNLKDQYTNVFVQDIREWNNFEYDLVIFGDVLEHMTKEDAITVWNKASKFAKHAIISIPIVHYPQGEWGGNPYEEHVKDDWTTKEVLETFTKITEHFESGNLGVFFATF